MKIRHLVIQNFKAIKQFEHSFVDELTGQVHPITAIFGDNGSGKTSVLQAIALVVSLATWKISQFSQFRWPGFLIDRIGSSGKEPYVRVDLLLEDDEIDAMQEAFTVWNGLQLTPLSSPSRDSIITIELKQGRIEVGGDEDKSRALLGRFYAHEIMLKTLKGSSFYERFGSIFWFDQYRNLGSGRIYQNTDANEKKRVDWEAGVSGLREALIAWWMLHEHAKGSLHKDLIVSLEKKFALVFPGSKFGGIELKSSELMSPTTSDWYFLIERGNTRYDVSEMASGEQAVFAILYDFVKNEISRSIVLIDELELHLHPPEQQALYNSLLKIGPDCQFIFTSHSPYLRDIMPPHRMLRLEGGRLCL